MTTTAIELTTLEPSGIHLPSIAHTVSPKPDNATSHQVVDALASSSQTAAVNEPTADNGPTPAVKLRGGKAIMLSLQLSLFTCINSMTTGLITIGIVAIAADLQLDPTLIYWPVLAYTLTSSPLMIPFGTFADVLGVRPVYLLGCAGCSMFVMACGLAKTGNELIAFRCLQGVSGALFLPTGLSIISTSLASGKLRNVAVSSLGIGMVLGFAIGLVLGGILLDTIGWRFGYYLCGGLQFALFLLGVKVIPYDVTADEAGSSQSSLEKLRTQVDWIGALISCAVIGSLSYVLAMVAEDASSVTRPVNLTLLVLSALLAFGFVSWMRFREQRGKSALIPRSLWKPTFTYICIIVAFANAEMQCMELLVSLFFQNVQALSPLQSSLRLIPGAISSLALNLVIGQVLHKVWLSWTMAGVSIIAGVSPLLMAVIDPRLPYWYEAFPAQLTYPFCIDVIFTVASVVISDSFSPRDQALAGAVFNTIANLGQALGLALVSVIANAVTTAQSGRDSSAVSESQVLNLMSGYRAAFWAAFGSMILTAIVSAVGLRKAGAVGVKRD